MTGQKVFLVEDDPNVAADLRQKLERLGYELCGEASTADNALNHDAMKNCNLVLLNVKLNKQIKGKTANKLMQQKFQIPVVFFSVENLFDEPTLKNVLEKVLKIYGT